MIRRTKHNFSASNNKLKQSSFVASKGINVLANPMEAQNVVDIVNFDVEDDGGVRIRKPIIATHNYTDIIVKYIIKHEGLEIIEDAYSQVEKRIQIIKVIYLYDKITRLVLYKDTLYEGYAQYGFCFLDQNDMFQPQIYMYTSYNGVDFVFNNETNLEYSESAVSTMQTVWLSTDFFNLDNVTYVNLNTTTILGNCTVDITKPQFNTTNGLYDPTVISEEYAKNTPRYLQISYLSTNKVWCVKIINPEMNIVSSEQLSDGTVTPTIKYNTTLDNNYAIRDEYNKSSVAVKTIIPYIYAELTNGQISPKIVQKDDTIINVSNEDESDFGVPVNTSESGASTVKTVYHTLETNYEYLGKTYKIKIEIELSISYDTGTDFEYIEIHDVNLYYITPLNASTITPDIKFSVTVMANDPTVRPLTSVTYTLVNDGNVPILEDTTGKILGYRCNYKHLQGSNSFEHGAGLPYDSGIACRTSFNGTLGVTSTECLNRPVKYLTERPIDTSEGFVPVLTFSKNTDSDNLIICFKAFMKFVDFNNLKYYAVWERTFDGVAWEQVFGTVGTQGIFIKKLKQDSTENYDVFQAQQICATSELDSIGAVNVRPDILVQELSNITPCTYRITIYTINRAKGNGSESSPYEIDLTLAQYSYELKFSEEYEYAYSTEQVHTSNGNKLYWKKRIYSYGISEFNNIIYPTDVDSFITPIQNAIDLDASSSTVVTALIPWRDYLVAATSNAMYLITPVDGGYTAKIINTAVGIPEEDSQTCKAILNGIIFKSGSKVYSLFPNMYSGTDNVLNLSEMSKPIDGLIPNTYTDYSCFAFTTERYYYLFIPVSKGETLCFKYNFNSRTWVKHSYPICIKDYTLLGFDDIRIFDESKEYLFECDDFRKYADISKPYGDILTKDTVNPIDFRLDSGQKTDNISTDKQFVETKLIASLTNNENIIPLDIDIYIDGNKFPFKIDLTTDGTFVKDAIKDIITLNATVDSNSVELQNVLKQLFLRYSGKGKSIRHIISGKSMCDFKLYEIYYRYKTLNVKQ